ncbi:potassium channel family protein [Natrarchaeobaculum aegyptiacum]|uniref:Potassium channel domain-containing protein n=1 Tax=Natrarchaeobaculum aegyptiacum TaxID=745377 RepID=A0A2Z2HR21_9EURY|nr:potassium channel family protein [Natrarchaeobaculum aegyptiacum]ARS89462.1 hypothetical protein B1756_06690 [Natrarchaeobaculum aegyptiacum]
MDPLYLVAGALVLALVVLDVLWTTLWVDGGSGPLSSRLTTGIWQGLRIASGDRSRALSLAGPLILAATLVVWIGLLWLGWTLLFAGGQPALVSTHTGEPADWTGRLYYVAYTMFTNGNGDYTPTTGSWEIASALTTASGMAFVTLAVSYVLSVLGAVSEKRSFASDVTGLGESPEAFVRSSLSEEGFRGLELPLESMADQLSLLADQHESYPILHYYHSEDRDRASAVGVAILDESLSVYRHGVVADPPNETLVTDARASVDSYLETLETAFVDPAEEVPPPPAPALETLREADVSTVEDESFEESIAESADRRRKLLGMVRADAREWSTDGSGLEGDDAA